MPPGHGGGRCPPRDPLEFARRGMAQRGAEPTCPTIRRCVPRPSSSRPGVRAVLKEGLPVGRALAGAARPAWGGLRTGLAGAVHPVGAVDIDCPRVGASTPRQNMLALPQIW